MCSDMTESHLDSSGYSHCMKTAVHNWDKKKVFLLQGAAEIKRREIKLNRDKDLENQGYRSP